MSTPPTPPLSPRAAHSITTTTTTVPTPQSTLNGREVYVPPRPHPDAVLAMPCSNDLTRLFLSLVNFPTLINVQKTCKTWYHLLNDDPEFGPICLLLPIIDQVAAFTSEAQAIQDKCEQELQESLRLEKEQKELERLSSRHWTDESPMYSPPRNESFPVPHYVWQTTLRARHIRNELNYNQQFPLDQDLLSLIQRGSTTHVIELLQCITHPVKRCAWVQQTVLAFLKKQNAASAAEIAQVFGKLIFPVHPTSPKSVPYPLEKILEVFSLTDPQIIGTISSFFAQSASPYALLNSFFFPAWEIEALWIKTENRNDLFGFILISAGLSPEWCAQQGDKYTTATVEQTVKPFYQNLLTVLDSYAVHDRGSLIRKQIDLSLCYDLLFHKPLTSKSFVSTLLEHLSTLSCSNRSKLLLLADRIRDLITCRAHIGRLTLRELINLIEGAKTYSDPSDSFNPVQITPLIYFTADWIAYSTSSWHPHFLTLAPDLLAHYGLTSSTRDEELTQAIRQLKHYLFHLKPHLVSQKDAVNGEFPPPWTGQL